MFTWIPIYEEAVKRLLDFKNRSDELRWSIQTCRLRLLLRNGLAHADPDVPRDASQAQGNLLRHALFNVDLEESP